MRTMMLMLMLFLIGLMLLTEQVASHQRQSQIPTQKQQQEAAAQQKNYRPYLIGEKFRIECKDSNNEWGSGPQCVETGEELSFTYGVDGVVSCGWSVQDEQQYAHMSALIARDKSWECRIRLLPELDFHVPFFIPVWGVVEPTHIHVDNHMNFVFHAWAGKILGVAAYPVRDSFQPATPGGVITVHGPVKWFRGGTFDSFSSPTPRSDLPAAHGADGHVSPVALLLLVAVWSLISALFTLLICVIVYQRYLKPRVIARTLKIKTQ